MRMVPKIGFSLETESDLNMAQLDQLDFWPFFDFSPNGSLAERLKAPERSN
jgi:hypothetical protein